MNPLKADQELNSDQEKTNEPDYADGDNADRSH